MVHMWSKAAGLANIQFVTRISAGRCDLYWSQNYDDMHLYQIKAGHLRQEKVALSVQCASTYMLTFIVKRTH